MFNGGNLFFLTHFNDDSADSKPTQVASSNSNQTNSKHNTIKTAVTAEVNIHHQNKPVNISEFDLMQNVVDGLKAKAAFEPVLINTLVKYFENAHCLYQYAQLIFKTKKALHFETNCYMKDALVKTMRNLIIQTKSNHKLHNTTSYIAKSLYKFF